MSPRSMERDCSWDAELNLAHSLLIFLYVLYGSINLEYMSKDFTKWLYYFGFGGNFFFSISDLNSAPPSLQKVFIPVVMP